MMLARNALVAISRMHAFNAEGHHREWCSFELAATSDERRVLQDAVNRLFGNPVSGADAVATVIPMRPLRRATAGQPGPIVEGNSKSPTEFRQPPSNKGIHMSSLNDSMTAVMQIDGALAAALVDYGSGMALAKQGSAVNLDAAAAGNTEVVKAKMRTMAGLGIKDVIEDILITLGKHYHLIRIVPHKPGLFLYLVLDKDKANLALARYKLADIEKTLAV
jgi:hypothetical protein